MIKILLEFSQHLKLLSRPVLDCKSTQLKEILRHTHCENFKQEYRVFVCLSSYNMFITFEGQSTLNIWLQGMYVPRKICSTVVHSTQLDIHICMRT